MKRMDTINVIPFIDIMLVLLAIVLTTATFIVEGRLDIRLPPAEGMTEPAPEQPVEIGIDRTGTLFLDSDPLPLDGLAGRLAALDRQTPIILRVDADTRFAAFVAVVDLLKAQRLERLTILTRRP
ncbi:MAG: biopolymer transporter ExbD [Chromatiaceae bacterium]|jgi:biopolymer transport protein ExbD|nr:biopolymer transporter ExbD [Chromatiaceae bacterium]